MSVLDLGMASEPAASGQLRVRAALYVHRAPFEFLARNMLHRYDWRSINAGNEALIVSATAQLSDPGV